MDESTPELRARKVLLIEAVDARAHGMALRWARFRPLGTRAPWANSLLGYAPWSPALGERMVNGLRGAIVSGIMTALPRQGVLPLTPATFRSSTDNCSSIAR